MLSTMKPTEKELKCIKYARRFYKIPFWHKYFHKNEYEVSDLKTFEQLWSDFGLRDYGSNYLHRGPFRKEEKIKCLQYWVVNLYSVDIDIYKWYNEIRVDLINQLTKFYEKNPGCRIQMQKAEDLIIEKIELKFGQY